MFAWLVPATMLAACAAGSSIRVAEGEDSTSNGPVSLAPAPADDAEAAPSRPTEYEADSAPQIEAAGAPSEGYAPYGSAARTLELRRIGQWTRTGISEARRLVIRDANAWDQFWSELAVGDRPAVDFTRDVVVVVAAGQRSSGGHEIAVDRVTQKDGELSVEVVERTPGPNCMTTASLTQPVDVVVVPGSDIRGWSFVERKEVRGCR
jgi:hypothetical protein